jgi:hypothetical protein
MKKAAVVGTRHYSGLNKVFFESKMGGGIKVERPR